MIIKPIRIPRRVSDAIVLTLVSITSPLWVPPLGLLFVVVWSETKISHALRPGREWEPWFAWRPVKLDIWSGDDAFTGTVWLETIYRRYRPMWGVEMCRLPPPSDAGGAG